MTEIKTPKVTIGLPVYNGERFIVKKLKSILNQTFKDFELIISDNSSIDNTAKICKEYASLDKRIRLFSQKNNIGAIENFNFVIDKANGEYFLWSAVDDILLPTFLEKNLKILETNPNVACSVSKMKLYGEKTASLEINSNDSIFKKIIKKIQREMGYMDTYSASGEYKKRVREYIKKLNHNQIIYGIFRTKQIRKSHVRDFFFMVEGCTILNILKYGELFVVDEILMEVYDGGVSRSGMLGVSNHMNENLIGKILPNYHFTLWCFRNLSLKIFLNSLGFFIKINCIGGFSLLVDLLRKLKKIKCKK